MTDCATRVGGAGTRRTIFACSGGGSNVGQILDEAALRSGREGYGMVHRLGGSAAGIARFVERTRAADERAVIDGCPVQCAKRLVDAAGMPIERYCVLTELGIVRSPDRTSVEGGVATALAALR